MLMHFCSQTYANRDCAPCISIQVPGSIIPPVDLSRLFKQSSPASQSRWIFSSRPKSMGSSGGRGDKHMLYSSGMHNVLFAVSSAMLICLVDLSHVIGVKCRICTPASPTSSITDAKAIVFRYCVAAISIGNLLITIIISVFLRLIKAHRGRVYLLLVSPASTWVFLRFKYVLETDTLPSG